MIVHPRRLARPILAAVLALVVVAFGLSGGMALSQTQAPPAAPPSLTEEQLSASVDKLAERLKRIETSVDRPDVTQQTLYSLATDVAPLATEAQTLVDRLTPRTAAIKARLDQLGAKVNGESAEVTKQREGLQKTYDTNDGLLKRAKTLEVQATQDGTYLARKQRTLFTNSLFKRSFSVLSPPLWLYVAKETPANIAATTRIFNDWLSAFERNLVGGKAVAFYAMILAALILYLPLRNLTRRAIRHESKLDKPTTWQKIVVSCWTSVSAAASLIAIMYAVVFVFSFFVAPDPTVEGLFTAMQEGVVRIAIAIGLSRGILAPHRSAFRLVAVDDSTSRKLFRLIIAMAAIVAGAKVIEALNEMILADWRFSAASGAVGALLVTAAMALALVDLGDDPETVTGDDDTGATASRRRDYYGVIRGIAWTLIVVLTVSLLIGYVSFATFLVDQVELSAAAAALLFLAIRLIDKSCELGLRPSSMVGRNLVYTVGMRRETLGQLAVLISGAARLVLIGLALIVLVAQWGLRSTDIAGNLHAVFFGFKVGDITISIEGIVVAIVSFLLVLAATRAIQGWLEDRYLPQTRLDSGLRNSIKTSLGYVGFLVALALAAANLGVDFQKLAIVAGALSVGIGFGLQSIVNNFVSGLILLWERAVRVGDWVVVGSDQGYVRKINVRSTEIETFDRASVIVPNSNLVSGVVKNLMRSDRVGRLTIEISVHASADPEKVRESLIEIARDNEAVLSLPSPQVRFTNLTATSMTFDLFCFVADVESGMRTKSDLYFAICRQFRDLGFFNGPAPDPTAINILGLDRLEAILDAGRAMPDGGDDAPTARKTA